MSAPNRHVAQRLRFRTRATCGQSVQYFCEELRRGGYEPRLSESHDDGSVVVTARGAQRGLLTLLRPPGYSVTIAEVQNSCGIELSVLSSARRWPLRAALIVHSLLVIALPPLAVLVFPDPGQAGERAAVTLGLIPLMLVAAFVYPGGLAVAVSYYLGSAGVARRAFERRDYPLHSLPSGATVVMRPFGAPVDRVLFVIALPYAILFGLLMAAIGEWLLVPLSLAPLLFLVARPPRSLRPSPAVVHRRQLLMAVALTFVTLGAGVHLRTVLFIGDGWRAGLAADVVCVSGLSLLSYGLLVLWAGICSSSENLERVRQSGAYAEHLGDDYPIGMFHAVLVGLGGLFFWAVLAMPALLLLPRSLLPADWLGSYREAATALPTRWLLLAGLSGTSLVGMRLYSLREFAKALRYTAQASTPLEYPPEPVLPVLARAQRHRAIHVSFARSDGPGAGACSLVRWPDTYSVTLAESVLVPGAEARLQAVVAHELAHCLLKHHRRSRRLRLLGALLLLDPLSLTAYIDHSRDEEDADRLGAKLLGGGPEGYRQMVAALRDCKAAGGRRGLAGLDSLPLGFFSSSESCGRAERGSARLVLLRDAWRGFLGYLSATRVLYVHPSLDRRIALLEREAEALE